MYHRLVSQCWDLLEFLPRPEPSPSFTNRTLEKLSPVRTTMTPQRIDGRYRPWLLPVGWAAAVVVAATGGFAGMNGYQQRRINVHQQLVRELRLLENKRFYERVDSFEFLKDLDHPDLFGDDHPDS